MPYNKIRAIAHLCCHFGKAVEYVEKKHKKQAEQF
jgi:hypothetical protein